LDDGLTPHQRQQLAAHRARRSRASYYLPPRQLFAIGMLLLLLFAVVALRDACADGVANLYRAMEAPPEAPPPSRPVAPPVDPAVRPAPNEPIEIRPMQP
jgi:hypothetical protein